MTTALVCPLSFVFITDDLERADTQRPGEIRIGREIARCHRRAPIENELPSTASILFSATVGSARARPLQIVMLPCDGDALFGQRRCT